MKFLLYALVLITSSAVLGSTKTDFFPNNIIKVNHFNTTVSYRQNWCAQQENYDNGEVSLGHALNGSNINIAIGNDPDFVNLDEDGNIDPSDPGLVIDLLDEIAKRGDFSWRNSFVIENFNASSSNKTWTDNLLWLIDTYDVTARWWVNLPSRIAEGASFPKGWYDASLIIIAKKDKDTYFEGSGFDPLNWIRTFTLDVWLYLIGILIITGIILCYLEETETFHEIIKNPLKKVSRSRRQLVINMSESRRQMASNGQSYRYFDVILSYIHDSFLVITGHLDLQPDTSSGQLVSFSLSLFAFLFLASYAANLVTFLVNERATFITQVNSLRDVVIMDRKVCVYGATATQESIEKVYSDATIIGMNSEKEALLGLKNGECDYAVVSESAWDVFKGIEDVNEGCKLTQIGRTFKEYDAGFAMRSDAGTLCTSLVRDVFNVHLHEMYDDGYLDEAWKNYKAKKQDLLDPCFTGDVDDEIEDAGKLDIINLGGVFIFHSFFLGLALLCRVVGNRFEKCNRSSSEVDIGHVPPTGGGGSNRISSGYLGSQSDAYISADSGSNGTFAGSQTNGSQRVSFVKFESNKSCGIHSNPSNPSRSSSMDECSTITALFDQKEIKLDELSSHNSGSTVSSEHQSKTDDKSNSGSTSNQVDGVPSTTDTVTLKDIQQLLIAVNERCTSESNRIDQRIDQLTTAVLDSAKE